MNLISKDELMKKINLLENAQDKFILIAAFSGVMVDSTTDISNVKKDDVDFKNKKIKVRDVYIDVDDAILKIIRDAIDQEIYFPISQKGGSQNPYKLNLDSEYILKGKPLPVNNNGTLPMTSDGLKFRFRTITNALGWNGVNTRILKLSGALHLLNEENKSFTVLSADEFLRNKGFKIRRANVLALTKLLNVNQQK